jgi:hypothetical protein
MHYMLEFGMGKQEEDMLGKSIMNNEFEIQSYVSTQLKRLDILHHGDQNAGKRGPQAGAKAKASGLCKGWPDMCILYRHSAYWVEFKASNGKLSKDQERVHLLMRECGQRVFVVQEKTKEEAWEKIKAMLGLVV